MKKISLLLFFVLSLGLFSKVYSTTLFEDSFSGSLSAWSDEGNNEWSIQNDELYVNYGISCGSVGCPQADLILNDTNQPNESYKASINFLRTLDATHGDYYQAIGNFLIWQSSNSKISISIGGSGWNSWDGQQSEVRVSIQLWDGSWSSHTSEGYSYSWNPNEWNKASIEKNGSMYSLYINDHFIMKFNDTFLNGEGKIGLHSYGTKRLDNFKIESLGSSCSSAEAGTVSSNLDIHMPSLDYQTLFGTQNIWVDFEYSHEENGKMYWSLKDYGANN